MNFLCSNCLRILGVGLANDDGSTNSKGHVDMTIILYTRSLCDLRSCVFVAKPQRTVRVHQPILKGNRLFERFSLVAEHVLFRRKSLACQF